MSLFANSITGRHGCNKPGEVTKTEANVSVQILK